MAFPAACQGGPVFDRPFFIPEDLDLIRLIYSDRGSRVILATCPRLDQGEAFA